MTDLSTEIDINDGDHAEQLRYIAAQAADARVNVEIETEGMTLNIGPQHPATHGTLRIVARLDGEQVIEAEPIMGYMHRGYEKLTEVRTYPQVTTLINRIDWVGSFANEVPFILAAEELMEVEAPPRAQYIRTALFEMGRIANIMLFLGDMAVQLGGVTAIFYAFRDREFVLNQIEAATGGRFHPNFNRIGGIKDDLPAGWVKETKAAMQKVRRLLRRDGRPGRRQRDLPEPLPRRRHHSTRRRDGLRPERCEPAWFGCRLGPAPRRRVAAGLERPRLEGLDSPRRRLIQPLLGALARRLREASHMVDQLLDGLPAGPVMAKVPRIIKVPAGESYVQTENPLGAMGYYVVSKGDLTPFRVKIRTASFSNMSISPWLLEGVYVPDIATILASLYFILGDIDR